MNYLKANKRLALVFAGLLAFYAFYRLRVYKKSSIAIEKKKQLQIKPKILPLLGPSASDPISGNFGDIKKCGSLHEYLLHLTAKYGPVGSFFWGEAKVAYVTSMEVLKLRSNRALQALHTRPPQLFAGFMPMIGEHSIQYDNDSYSFWKRYRNIYVAGYGQKSLHSKIGIMSKNAQELLMKWRSTIELSKSKEFIIDAVIECFSFASKSVIHSSFGSNISNELSQNFANGYLSAWNEMEERILNSTPITKEREEIFNNAINLMRNSVLEIIELNESENKNEEHVFLNHVTANPDLYPTQAHILDEAVTAITAGTHTTGNAMAWLLYYISIHPSIQQQMRDEIGSVFHEDMKQDMNEKTEDEWKEELEKCKELVFCQQVVFETLRITTMAPWAARVNYESDMILKNLEGVEFFIPKNMPVIIGLGCALKDEKVWIQPEIFDPNRWKEESMNKMQRYSKTFIFGGFGKRICPGYKFFQLESLVFLATILPCMQFALVDENLPKIMKFKHGLATSPTETISLRVSVR